MEAPYPYPNSNADIISKLKLEKHFEGGYFAQTIAVGSTPGATSSPTDRVQTASGDGTGWYGGAQAGPSTTVDATQIYYLLTPDSYRGKMHMNLHSTFHVHHSGRALYTLIRPPSSPSDVPDIRRVIMGPDPKRDEVLQLFVPGGWWKASEIPEEDMVLLTAPEGGALKNRIGCLISEIVVPGWNPDQHQFISTEKLKAMWGGRPGWERYTKYLETP